MQSAQNSPAEQSATIQRLDLRWLFIQIQSPPNGEHRFAVCVCVCLIGEAARRTHEKS